eukprot:TRINITY_DN705_c0_g1_i1.p1 TRINITY_DN705_c0_g1~~TRINITY_DN705_c0_g1_i1.p1  ORF type:complete len:193 (+),score=76.84 TRINITY_DN705_c0_g1_i1:76-579(+)
MATRSMLKSLTKTVFAPRKAALTPISFRPFSVSSMVRTSAAHNVEPNATKPTTKDTRVMVTFVERDGTKRTVAGKVGQNLLEVAHEHDIDLEGACEGSLACSTCHLIIANEFYGKLPEPSDEENDMLDLAFGLTERSRLGCQIKLTPELDGITAGLPAATRNIQTGK